MLLKQMLLIILCPALLFLGINFLTGLTYLVEQAGWFLLIPGNLLLILFIWYKKNKKIVGTNEPSYTRKTLKDDFINDFDDWFVD